MEKVLTFGEMMLRLKPAGCKRIVQSDEFEAAYGGSEANVAVSLLLQGDQASYVTKLPQNLLGTSAVDTLNKYGVNTSKILYGGNRLGIYFFEKGASVRSTNVVYDRKASSFADSKADEYDWDSLLSGMSYFYFSGITAAISDQMRETLLIACQYCHQNGIKVIFDTNYRGKMWSPGEAQQFSSQIMPYVDVCLANDEDFENSLGIKAFDGDMEHGIDQSNSFKDGMQEVVRKYPNCSIVASILRNINSVEDSKWTALLLKDGQMYESPIYNMHVYEGVASGDAFGAGLVHGLIHEFDNQKLIDYAISASVLKLTISGDLNLVNEREILNNMTKISAMSR